MNGSLPYHKLIIRSVERPVKDFCVISFEPGHQITYKAGQYLTLVFPDFHPEIRRSYSIVSIPSEENLAIGVKRKTNGIISRRLFDHAEAGDELLCIGAAGMFIIPTGQADRIFFFAAGSGITPVYSLIKWNLSTQQKERIILIYSNRSLHQTIFYKQLKTIASECAGRLQLIFLFSDHPRIDRARLTREFLLALMKRYEVKAGGRDLFYVCGPDSYMFKVTTVLQEYGIGNESIRKENFVIPVLKPMALEIPDTGDHVIQIVSTTGNSRVMVKFPQTILQAAKFAGMILPYSCETGRCGNCVATCVSGKVWHSNNEVLTQGDLDKGMILTCTAHPLSDDVVIKSGIE